MSAQDDTIRLSATWLNTIAANSVVIGSVTPWIVYSYALPTASSGLRLAALPMVWLIGGIALHLAARHIFSELD